MTYLLETSSAGRRQVRPFPASWPICVFCPRCFPLSQKPNESRNLLFLVLQQIVLRVGWIFKTESVIMPAFLDAISGSQAGLLRGFMPVLSRLGQSTVPLVLADRLESVRLKKWLLAAFACLLAVPFWALAIMWARWGGVKPSWLPILFLVLYCVFFIVNGLYLVAFGIVQGKLIRATRRGRLLRMSTFYGAIPAVAAAVLFMPSWLEHPVAGYFRLFLFVGSCFFVSGLLCVFLKESPDERRESHERSRRNFREAARIVARDPNLLRLVFVGVLYGSALIVFPHYQAFARERLGLSGSHLMVWVIVQNAAVAVFSILIGVVADSKGNRLALRILLFASTFAPLYVVLLPLAAPHTGASWFWFVFVCLGLTPLVFRILVNYTLEICEPAEHTRYLSATNFYFSLPFFFSPLVGQAVDRIGFEPVFIGAALCIFAAGILTFGLKEPRHRHKGDVELPPFAVDEKL